MIQVNATTHTKRGVTISIGSILCITPHFLEPRRNEELTAVEYDMSFDVKIYKNLADYEAGKDVLINDSILEYNIGFTAINVDIAALTSVNDLLQILANHIENGDGGEYAGVGAGKTAIVFPYSV